MYLPITHTDFPPLLSNHVVSRKPSFGLFPLSLLLCCFSRLGWCGGVFRFFFILDLLMYIPFLTSESLHFCFPLSMCCVYSLISLSKPFPPPQVRVCCVPPYPPIVSSSIHYFNLSIFGSLDSYGVYILFYFISLHLRLSRPLSAVFELLLNKFRLWTLTSISRW